MPMFRVPYPVDPERRRQLFEKAVAKLSRHGSCQGTPDAGEFQGSTPIGGFAGRYFSPEGSDVMEVEIHKKPWLVSLAMIESEARRFVGQA